MATFAELRSAIVATLKDALPDVHIYPKVPDRANLPAIVVKPGPATFPFTMGRAEDEWQFELVVMVPCTEASLAQEHLDVYLSGSGTTSIRQILMRNKTLGRNDVMAAYVAGMSDYGTGFTMAGIENLGCRLQVVVATTGPAWE
jgi:hypothetical protein